MPFENSTHRVTAHTARIETLPFDVILNILHYTTSWEDILSFEKASRLISEMFEQRDMWSALVTTCIEPPLGMPKLCRAERPIYTYGINELRYMFKRWKRAENIWTSANDPDKRRIRDLKFYFSAISRRSILAPGGRWLVAITHDAAGFYYDLDAPDTTHGSLLFPPQTGSPLDGAMNFNRCRIVTSRADRIFDTQTLSFRFSLWLSSTDDHHSSTVQVWETTLIFDEDVGVSRLSACKVASIPFSASLGPISIGCLVENHLVLNIPALANDPDDTALVMFDWREAHQSPSTFERRVLIAPILVNGCSLVEYNLLVSSLLFLKKYDYRRFRVATSWDLAQYNRNTQSLALFHGAHHSISDPISIQTTTGVMRMVSALGEKQIISVKLDSDYRDAPSWSSEVIGSFPPIMFCSWWMGYRHAFGINSDDMRLIIGHYRSPVGKGGTTGVIYLNIPMDSKQSVILHYDESIGRLILGDGTTRIRIIDFAV